MNGSTIEVWLKNVFYFKLFSNKAAHEAMSFTIEGMGKIRPSDLYLL